MPLPDETAAVLVALLEVVEAEGSTVRRWSVGIMGVVGLMRRVLEDEIKSTLGVWTYVLRVSAGASATGTLGA